MGSGVFRGEPGVLAVDAIGERFRDLRIVDPSAERAMVKSIRQYGQLSPVVICRFETGQDELLDGFKRLRAARSLNLGELLVSRLDVAPRGCKASMLLLNRVGRNISVMEEALVVHSLCHQDQLSQVEVAVLLGRHKSWVSRRVALIARLSDEAQERIRLGLLPSSLGVELARLQRCNQLEVLECIRRHHLTWRETRKLVETVLRRPVSCWAQVLSDPRRATAGEDDVIVLPGEEKGLSAEAKSLLRTLSSFERTCLAIALLLSGTELAGYQQREEKTLRFACQMVDAGLTLVVKELQVMMGGSGDDTVHPQQR